MNITFLVGNGFDINLGLNTKYTDFYPTYLSNGHDDILSRAIADNYDKWADLEIALGKVLKDVTPEQIDEFLDSKGKLEGDLAEYLRHEESRLDLSSAGIPSKFQKNIAGFAKEFTAKEQADFSVWQSGVHSSIIYRFISYNYTNGLDRVVEQGKTVQPFASHVSSATRYTDSVGSVHHIHGTLDGDLILGINDASQIDNPVLQTDDRLVDYIVKAEVNEALGEQRMETAKRIIDESDYIGVYGMSIGDTDLMWWQYLLAWMQKKDSRRLVLYIYTDPSDNPSGQEKLRQINMWKNVFLAQAGADAELAKKVRGQIIVVIRSKIFNFDSITVKDRVPEKVLISV